MINRTAFDFVLIISLHSLYSAVHTHFLEILVLSITPSNHTTDFESLQWNGLSLDVTFYENWHFQLP